VKFYGSTMNLAIISVDDSIFILTAKKTSTKITTVIGGIITNKKIPHRRA
jgi:glucose uptake protein GlcU